MARLLPALISCLLLASAFAQECEQELQQRQALVDACYNEKEQLSTELKQARDLTQQWVDHAGKLEESHKGEVQQLQGRIQELEQAVSESQKLEDYQAKYAQQQHRIEELEKTAKKAKKDLLASQKTATALQTETHAAKQELAKFKETVESAQNSWLPLWVHVRIDQAVAHLKVLSSEISSGSTDNEVTLALHKGYKTVAELLYKAYVAAEPHLKFAKEKFDELYSQVAPHIEKHITSAAWWKSLCAQAAQTEKELNTYVTRTLKSVPSLAPYADPVTVQLLVYFMFAAPVLTTVILGLALRPRKARSSSGSGSAARPAKAKSGQNLGKGKKRA